MNNILENNEDLHEEFKTLLVKIEPHFVALKSNLEKLLCREWLHKLFKTGKHEESLRNAYLSKLFEQLVKGKLKEPFNNLPKHKSPLLPLTIPNLPKQNINVHDKKPIKKVEETLITDVVNVLKTIDAPPNSTENHVHTNEIKMFVDVHDHNTKKREEETLIKDEVNVHKTVDALKSMKNYVPTNEIKKFVDVRDRSTIKKEEETLIRDEINVHKTVDAPKSTEKHVPTNKIKKFVDVVDRNIIKKEEETIITDVVNVHKTVYATKPSENCVHTNEIKIVNESSNQSKQLDVNEIADDSKEVQWQKSTADKSEGGDGLTLNVETKLKLGSVEKLSIELKKKSELLAEQVQDIKLYTDKNLINNDQIIVLNTELNKFQNDLEKMCNREAADELSVSKLLENILEKITVLDNKIVSEMHRLKTIVEDACVSKKSNNFVMEQLKKVHHLKMDEKEKFHEMLNRKLMLEVSQLKDYVGKVEEKALCKQLNDENYYEDDCSSA